jgi:hypothetical protein
LLAVQLRVGDDEPVSGGPPFDVVGFHFVVAVHDDSAADFHDHQNLSRSMAATWQDFRNFSIVGSWVTWISTR